MHVESNSKEWNYCVGLHNEINLCDDPDVVLEKLLALIAFFCPSITHVILVILLSPILRILLFYRVWHLLMQPCLAGLPMKKLVQI